MPPPEKDRLGDRLRASRTDRGLSLREVERRSGINNGYLSQLERNEIANPTPSVLQKVAIAYEEPFGVLMRWAGYIEDDPNGVSPNAKRALDTLGDDFTDQELQALRAVLDAIRAKNRATFAPHRTDLVLEADDHLRLRQHAVAVLREIDAINSSSRVDMDDVFLVSRLVKVGAIELTLEEKKRLRLRFKDLVDWALDALQGVVHLDRGEGGEVYLNPALDQWERRKRFVMGHEAAHAILDDHRVTFAHLDDKTRLRPDFADRLERQANQFSIELLAKGDRLREEFDDSAPSMSAIDRLSSEFGISLEAAARRLAEESQQPCAVAIAYWARRGAGDLLVDHHKLWCSRSFEERLGWKTGSSMPREAIKSALRLAGAGGTSPLMSEPDRDGRLTNVHVEGMNTRFAAMVLLSCDPRSRMNLRRANPFLRVRSA